MQVFFSNLTTLQLVFVVILGVALITQLFYYFYFYLRINFRKKNNPTDLLEPISVIICARNESENLLKHLPVILEQSYPVFEVVVVNDCSVDDTETVLAEFKLKYPHLRSTTIQQDKKFSHGKKLALTIGMKAAKYEKLVMTDADCVPVSNQWLKEISYSYTKNTQIVIGYGGYKNQPGILNKLIRYDTLFIALQYFGFALAKKPYMGVGRNLSYNKSLYFNGKGFTSHYKIQSGDDDLFVNEHATKENTSVCLSKESFTCSIPNSKFSLWAKQKKRHLTSSPYYKRIHKWLLGTENITRLLFFASLITLFILQWNHWVLLGVFVLRLTTQLLTIKLAMNKLNEKGLWLWSPIFDIILPLIYLFFIISNPLNRQRNRWN